MSQNTNDNRFMAVSRTT